jgi:hypothetical protein
MIANLHSTTTKVTMQIPPRVIIDITIGLFHSKYVPPPEIGMSRRRIAEELNTTP